MHAGEKKERGVARAPGNLIKRRGRGYKTRERYREEQAAAAAATAVSVYMCL